jgi:hypothetical protein
LKAIYIYLCIILTLKVLVYYHILYLKYYYDILGNNL